MCSIYRAMYWVVALVNSVLLEAYGQVEFVVWLFVGRGYGCSFEAGNPVCRSRFCRKLRLFGG